MPGRTVVARSWILFGEGPERQSELMLVENYR